MKNVIDLNRTRIEPSLENYNLVVSEFLNSNKLVHVSIEEIIFDSEKCINNLDKFFDITTRIGNENNISTELGLEAISLCKELNIDLVIKKNLFNKKQYVVSNEEVNVGLIAMIAAAVIAIGVVLKKIWNLLTGNSSGNNSTSGGNVEEKKKAIDTTEKIISTYNATTPTIKTKIVEVDKLMISYAKEIKSNNEITDNLLKFKTIFEYIDSDLRHPSLSGISNTLENFYDSLNGITKAIMFSELDNSFYGKIEEILSDSSTIVKYIAPVINNLDDSVELIMGVYERLNSTNGITKAQRLLNVDIDKAVELLSNDKINDDSEMNNISNLADKIKSVNISGLEVHDKELNSAVFFNLYGSEGIHKVSNLIYTYQQFLDKTVRQFPSQFDDRFKNINTDLTNIESKYKTLFENNTSEDISNFKEKIDNYFSIVKETVTRLNGIVTSIARAAVLSETILDANNKLFIGMSMHKSAMIEAFTRLAKLILNNNKSSGADGASAMEFVKQLNSLVELMNSTNKKIKDVIGNISDYKDLSDKDVFMKFIKNANVLSGKTYNVSNEQYDVASIEYLPSNEDYTTSQIRHNVNHYNVFDLNSIKVNKMHLGINTTALEEFIKDINLDNEIGIENNAALESFYKELDIDSISVEQYLDKADKLFDLNNRIISSGAITKEIGLEAISICNDLNINVNKLSLYPSKIGYSVSLEAVGVGIFAMIVAAIAAVVYIAKKVWSAIMGEGSSGSGGGGGGFDTDDVAVEKKITAIETTQEVSQQIVENKVIIEDKIEDVSVALKETISSPEVKEVVKEIEKKKELSPLVKYVLNTNYSNIFDLLNKLPETDIAYGPLVSVVNQLRNLKSFEKEIVLSGISHSFATKVLFIVNEILQILPEMITIAKSTGHEYEKMSTILDTIVQKNMTNKDATQYFETEYKVDNPSPFSDNDISRFDDEYGAIKEYLSNSDLDNKELNIASLYAYKTNSEKYSEFIKELSDMLTEINEHNLFNQLTINEKTIRYFDEHIDKINSPILTENGEFKNVFINAAKYHMATFNVIKQYIIIYGKVTLTLEKIIESKLKIDLIIEAYLKAATGQLVELKKRLKSDFSSIDKEHNSDALQKRLSVFYDQIDDLVELSNGCSKDILDIISKDPNHKDIKNSDETFNRFLLRMTNVSKVTTGAVATGNEKYEIMLRPRYDILTYSNEAYSSSFIGIIAAGLILILAVIGKIIKLFIKKPGDEKELSETITNSSKVFAKLPKMDSSIVNTIYDFNLESIDYTTRTKINDTEIDKNIDELIECIKEYGHKDPFLLAKKVAELTGGETELQSITSKINNVGAFSKLLLNEYGTSGFITNIKDMIKSMNIKSTKFNDRSTLEDITKMIKSKDVTEDKLQQIITVLNDEAKYLGGGVKIAELIITASDRYEIDSVNEDYDIEKFFTSGIKIIQDKSAFDNINSYYASTAETAKSLKSLYDDVNKLSITINNLNDTNFDKIPHELLREFKDSYRSYVNSMLETDKEILIFNQYATKILKEYMHIYQCIFELIVFSISVISTVLLVLKKNKVNTIVQLQNIRKTVNVFLPIIKEIINTYDNYKSDKDSYDNKFVIIKPTDVSGWTRLEKSLKVILTDIGDIGNEDFNFTIDEKYEIMLRPRYDTLTYSNEAYNAPFIGLIATGLIIFLSVIGAILKKIFGINKGSSSDSKNTEKNITSSSKALAVLSNNTSHAIEFSHFDFNISNLNISTIKKPTTMEDKEYETISQLATEFKKYGDNKIFEFFEYATGYNNEKLTPIAEKIKDKINNLNGLSNSLLSGKLAKTWDEYKKTKEIGITEVSRLVTNIEQLNDITKLLEKDSLTGDDLTAEIKSLVAKQEELTNITEMLTNTNTSVVDMVNSDDESSYTLSTFLPTMEKLIQDKTLSNSIITTYGSTSVLVSNIQQFVDKIEKEKEKISNFNPNVNDIPKEITDQFKEAYQAYIKSTVNLQTALFTLSANIQRILKEYKNIYQMFFTISFDMLRIVFVTLADLKKCNINTATQHQLLHKTVKDFLKVAKDTLDEIEGPLRFDQESTYYVMAKPDIDIWKKIAGGFDKLERDLFNITNKMVRGNEDFNFTIDENNQILKYSNESFAAGMVSLVLLGSAVILVIIKKIINALFGKGGNNSGGSGSSVATTKLSIDNIEKTNTNIKQIKEIANIDTSYQIDFTTIKKPDNMNFIVFDEVKKKLNSFKDAVSSSDSWKQITSLMQTEYFIKYSNNSDIINHLENLSTEEIYLLKSDYRHLLENGTHFTKRAISDIMNKLIKDSLLEISINTFNSNVDEKDILELTKKLKAKNDELNKLDDELLLQYETFDNIRNHAITQESIDERLVKLREYEKDSALIKTIVSVKEYNLDFMVEMGKLQKSLSGHTDTLKNSDSDTQKHLSDIELEFKDEYKKYVDITTKMLSSSFKLINVYRKAERASDSLTVLYAELTVSYINYVIHVYKICQKVNIDTRKQLDNLKLILPKIQESINPIIDRFEVLDEKYKKENINNIDTQKILRRYKTIATKINNLLK